jgi:hypothetical protein
MPPRIRASLAAALSLTIALIACSLPESLLRRAASEAIDEVRETALPEGETGEGDEVDGDEGPAPELPGGLLGGSTTSPAYDIYVGANVTGRCGPTTNSGGFASLTFDSVIYGVRFWPPSETGLPGPFGGISQEGGIPIGVPGIGLLGEGELGAFSFCPMYEAADAAHPCTVTEGPSPFEPSLSVGMSEDGVPLEPLTGTPVPSGGGEALLVYSIGATSDLSPIMRWECVMGIGALGGSVQPVQVAFSTSWDRLMLGEEFSLGAISGDEGETWEWTIRLVPSD